MNILSLFGQEATPYYNTTLYSNPDSAAAAGVSAFVMILILAIMLVVYVIVSYLLSRIFKKAGIESWKAWVPVYSNWILLELGGQKGYWAIITLIPIVGIVGAIFMIIAMYHIGLKFGKDGVFVLLAVFLPLVWMAWLALDKSTWHGKAAPAATAPQNPGAPTTPTT